MQIHKYSQANQDYLTFDELLLPTDDLMRDFIFTLCVFVLHSSKFMGSTPCYGFHMRLNRKPNLFLRFLIYNYFSFFQNKNASAYCSYSLSVFYFELFFFGLSIGLSDASIRTTSYSISLFKRALRPGKAK